ncbi:hypothetical protein HDU76_006025 [Blyttiomyces sp. JEL0837]|nr:hypothetical protein HDU76_006025 [Blyttiomyces sp. JEL0837]
MTDTKPPATIEEDATKTFLTAATSEITLTPTPTPSKDDTTTDSKNQPIITNKELNEAAAAGEEIELSNVNPGDVDPEKQAEQGEFVKWTTATLVPLFVGLVSAHFLAALDATIVSTALPNIASEFHSLSEISFVATAYVLTFNSFQPLVGKFSQIFGHRVMTLSGIILFMAGSAGCGAATSLYMLVAFRALQGIGGAALLSMVLICISDMFAIHERPKYLTVLWINFGISTIIGPLLGGAFTDNLTWRWCFYINLPVGVIAFPLVWFFLRLPFKKQSFNEQIKRVDFPGTVLLLVSVLMILLPTTLGGSQWAWSSAQVIACFVVAAVTISALIYIELYYAVEPIIPPHLFKIRNVVVIFLTNFFQGGCFFAFVFYGPTYFEVLKGDSATQGGLQLLPLLLGLVIFSIVGTMLLPIVKRYQPFIITGSALITAGTFWFSTLDESATRGAEIGALLIVGIGLGLSIQMNILTAQASVSQADTGTVSALASFFQSIGGGIGLAILSSIFNQAVLDNTNHLPQYLQDIINAGSNSSSSGGFGQLHKLPLPESDVNMIIHVYVDALQKIFRYATPFGAISFMVPWFLTKTRIQTPEEMMKNGPSH